MTPRELESLIFDLFDGMLAEEKLDKLQHELRTNPAARDVYRDIVHLQNAIQLHVSVPRLIGQSIIPIDLILGRQRKKTLRIATFAAAAVFVMSMVTMALFMAKETPPILTFATSPGTQFSLTHSRGAEASEDLTVERGSRLMLSQGTVELSFASGVKSIVIAPADLTVQDENSLLIGKGTAWFQVPAKAAGFRVKTKDLDIVDLGTEFGLITHLDEDDEVHVFKGEVRATANHSRKETITLRAGQARRVDPIGRLNPIASNRAVFLTRLPSSLPFLHWSFDEKDGFQVTGTHPAAATTTTTPWPPSRPPSLVPGKHGTALDLDGAEQYLSTDWPGFSGNRARTVAFWLKLPRDGDYTALPAIVDWGDAAMSNGKWKILLAQEEPGAERKLRLSLGDYWLDGTSDLVAETWVHIAISASGKLNDTGQAVTELYIDGKRETTTYEFDPLGPDATGFDTVTNSSGSSPFSIGSSLQRNSTDRVQFHGQLDEMTLFEGHMDEDAIQNLYQQSR